MIRRTPLLLLPLLLLACASGSAKVGGDSGDEGLDVGEDGEDGGDGADGSGDGTDGDEPQASTADWADDWTASVDLLGQAFDYEVACVGEFVVTFDEAGVGSGDGSCAAEGVGDLALTFTGDVTAEGDVSGVLVVDLGLGGAVDADLSGSASGDDLIDADAAGELEVAGYTLDIAGTVTFTR